MTVCRSEKKHALYMRVHRTRLVFRFDLWNGNSVLKGSFKCEYIRTITRILWWN